MTDRLDAPQTILVVEDEVFIRMVICEYLRGCGYRVIEAVSADEAVTLLQHSELDVDVVFSDIEMPGSMNGFELSEWIRTHRAGVEVVLAGNVTRAANAAAELCNARRPGNVYRYYPQVVARMSGYGRNPIARYFCDALTSANPSLCAHCADTCSVAG